MASTTLLNSVSADTTGQGICGNKKKLVAYVWATNFGGGTVTIECSPDQGTTWFTCKHLADDGDATFTSNGYVDLQPVGSDAWIRAVLSGSTSPSNVNARVLCY
jgi:hypothetical protein